MAQVWLVTGSFAVSVAQLLKRALPRAIRCWRQLGALNRWLICGTIWRSGQALRVGCHRRSSSGSRGKDGDRSIWLAGCGHQQCGIWQSFVHRRHASIGIPGTDRNKPLRNDYCDQGSSSPYFRERKAGHFIQFSSVGGRIGPPGRGPYSAAKWGVEGFSEVLSREVAPLGIKVTIVEPGGFRTDFAGSSTELSDGHPAYDSTVGATARFQRNYNGKQPGDPKKAAQVIIHLTHERNPPLRLLLGSDAYTAVEKNDLARLEEARIWKELSVSTDFETK